MRRHKSTWTRKSPGCCVLYIRLLKRQLILLCGCFVRVVYDMTPLQRLHGRWDAWGLLVEQEDSVRVNT